MRNAVVMWLAATLLLGAGCGSLTRRSGAVPSPDLETLDTMVGERRMPVAPAAAPDSNVTGTAAVEEAPVTVAAVPEEAPEETATGAERLAAEEPAAPAEAAEGGTEALDAEETLPEPEPPAETAAAYRSVYLSGYRVQLMATTEPDRARDFAESVRPLFGDNVNVYVEYLAPYYKVRVGDCTTRSEAVLLLNRARKNGFSESWITATQIIDWTKGNR